jgi:hypothetical protein
MAARPDAFPLVMKDGEPARAEAGERSLAWRLLTPAMGDFFFLALLCWLFIAGVGWLRLMFDGDTGVHIRVGDRILAEGAAPVVDTFAFSLPGQTWYAFEWLSGVVFSLLHSSIGLQGVAALTGIVLAGTITLLMRYLIWKGVNWLVAMPLLFSATTALYLNFLARPHIFTQLFLVIAIWLVDADRRHQTMRIWWLVPTTIVWTNLHGGFVILFPFLGVMVAGLAAEGWLWADTSGVKWAQARRYGVLGIACAAASLVNPYGIRLHQHIYETMQAAWLIDFSKEFQSPSFRNEYYLHFMLLLFLGLGAATVLLERRRLAEAGWIIFMAYASLTSARHGSLFVLSALPLIAELLSEGGMHWASRQPKRSVAAIIHAMGLEKQDAFGRSSLWTLAFAACLFLPLPIGQWPTDIKPEMAPAHLVARNAQMLEASRVFSDDEIGDYLIYKNYPKQQVFLDGRHNYYGEKVANDFLAILNGGRRWQVLVERYRVNAMLIDDGSALAVQLSSNPQWKRIDREGQWALYQLQ